MGIAGPTGSGKSSFLRLIARLYDPQQGHVLFEGVPTDQLVGTDGAWEVYPVKYGSGNNTRGSLFPGIGPDLHCFYELLEHFKFE